MVSGDSTHPWCATQPVGTQSFDQVLFLNDSGPVGAGIEWVLWLSTLPTAHTLLYLSASILQIPLDTHLFILHKILPGVGAHSDAPLADVACKVALTLGLAARFTQTVKREVGQGRPTHG